MNDEAVDNIRTVGKVRGLEDVYDRQLQDPSFITNPPRLLPPHPIPFIYLYIYIFIYLSLPFVTCPLVYFKTPSFITIPSHSIIYFINLCIYLFLSSVYSLLSSLFHTPPVYYYLLPFISFISTYFKPPTILPVYTFLFTCTSFISHPTYTPHD